GFKPWLNVKSVAFDIEPWYKAVFFILSYGSKLYFDLNLVGFKPWLNVAFDIGTWCKAVF
ncbi:25415_t:CDS:1, partial [Racocetra persica]